MEREFLHHEDRTDKKVAGNGFAWYNGVIDIFFGGPDDVERAK